MQIKVKSQKSKIKITDSSWVDRVYRYKWMQEIVLAIDVLAVLEEKSKMEYNPNF
jgi:hypothetical protein